MTPFASLLVVTALGFSAATHTHAEKPVSGRDFGAYTKLAQSRLDATKEGLHKELQSIGTRIDNQDKRIDQQSTRFSDINFGLAIFAILLTAFGITIAILAIVAGWLGFITVKSKTREQAREEAQRWFNENQISLTKKIEAFDERMGQLEKQLTEQANAHAATMKATAASTEDLAQACKTRMKENMSRAEKPDATLMEAPLEQRQALDALANDLRRKPEAEYSFDDWSNRAYAAYGANDKEGAARYFQKAASMTDLQPEQIAESLLLAGINLEGLEAIAVYDQIDKRFGSATGTFLREKVADALLRKGLILGEITRREEAIAVYEQIDKRFGSTTEIGLRMVVLNTLWCKSVILGELNRREEEVAVYDEIDKRFGSPTELIGFRWTVARARNCKGFRLLCTAKQAWAEEDQRISLLQAAARMFAAAEEDSPAPIDVWGNLAYCNYLLGQSVESVRPLLRMALESESSREYVRETILHHLEIYPVPPDITFRVLLDEVWTALRNVPPKNA